MSNYEGKLGEWLKYVQQAISGDNQTAEEETSKPETSTEQSTDKPERMVMRNRMDRITPDLPSSIDTSSVIADSSLINDRPEVSDRQARLFEDNDVPDVEDYLTFLKESERRPEPTSNRFQTPPPPIVPPRSGEILGQITRSESAFGDDLTLFEGTGEPKPIIRNSEPTVAEPVQTAQAAPVAEPKPVVESKPVVEVVKTEEAPKPVQSSVEAKPKTEPKPRTRAAVTSQPDAAELRELWDKLPRHIQLLMGQSKQEVAQHSYKKFKETRDELIGRLLDPTLSLEETARILNVCPTTVRRYTNRGVLKHLRTAGNQRRFRLSDVLGFLEANQIGGATESAVEVAQ